jgi:isoleucyl-tRNA synthetase
MFKPVSTTLNLPLMEEDILHFWQTRHIFQKSDLGRAAGTQFVFYEGPPTVNGKPGVHHALARAFKDIFLRYKSMQGYRIHRRAGWDTHGLPIEVEVEKQLGITDKSQIEAYGIAAFNDHCRKFAFGHIQEWEKFTQRSGFWVNLKDAYVTFTNEYIESLWWVVKQLWERQLLYQDSRVVPYCPRCGTPLSHREATLGSHPGEDPSIYVRMPLVDGPGTSLLVWTDAPWTLTANVAIAVHPEVEYVTVERPVAEGGIEHLVLARALLRKVFGAEDLKIVDRFKGRKLRGRHYHPLFTFLLPNKPAHFVVLQDYVTSELGTGLVHVAPAFNAEDLQTARANELPVLMTITDSGAFRPEVRPWSGIFVKDADALIIQELARRGLLLEESRLAHTSPFCWRCEAPLLYIARNTWHVRTSQIKDRLIAINQHIHWLPEPNQNGWFGNWLEKEVDWVLGRERYWGAPLPIWQCTHCDHQLVIGSLQELAEYTGRTLATLDLHRPYVDEVRFPCPQCGGEMQRVPEVIDAWFDSGAMPLAQWHYPFENQEIFQQQFPADFVCEAADQTGGWFYALHALGVMLFESESFKKAICLDPILDSGGRRMSASHGNILDAWEVFNTQGADALRWCLYTSKQPGRSQHFSLEQVGDALRSLTLPLWNVYAFFIAHANLIGWEPAIPKGSTPSSENLLDRWLLSELQSLIKQVSEALEGYDAAGATRPVQAFVSDLSNWYLRRSRQRFRVNAEVEDQRAACTTLYLVLVTLSKLLAPSMPFLAEALYQNLVHAVNDQAPESVHLTDWPDFDPTLVNSGLHADMLLTRDLASLGHAARQQAGIKVRQPLTEIAFSLPGQEEARILEQYAGLLADELNVKNVRRLGSAGEAVAYRIKPLPNKLGQKYKSLFPKISQALREIASEEAARQLFDGQPVHVTVEGIRLEIQPEEVALHVEPRGSLAVATHGPFLAALPIRITPELAQEGLSGEFVRRVQELRKQADFKATDRIRIYFQASQRLAQALQTHQKAILEQTLAVEMLEAQPPAKAAARGAITRAEFNGERMTLGLLLVV